MVFTMVFTMVLTMVYLSSPIPPIPEPSTVVERAQERAAFRRRQGGGDDEKWA